MFLSAASASMDQQYFSLSLILPTVKNDYIGNYLGQNSTGSNKESDHVPFMGGIYPLIPLPTSLGGGKHPASAAHVTKCSN